MDTDTSTVLMKDLEATTYIGGSNNCVKPHSLAVPCLIFPIVKKALFLLYARLHSYFR